MRYLILSDVHGNLDALDAVLEQASGRWDQALVLGDLVGYGAQPNEVIARLRGLSPLAVIRGNHDKAACGLDDGAQFNFVARFAAAWTSDRLTSEHREYLRSLPAGPIEIDDRVMICHGSPFDEDHYIFDGSDARYAVDAATRPLCLYGHTHLPAIFRQVDDLFEGAAPNGEGETVLPIQRGVRYLVNCGSVGQPRDGDPRAAFGMLDDEQRELRLIRVEYPVEAAQARILEAGLPPSLANRLAIGR